MIEIIPSSIKSEATISVPGSKSVTNRALLLAALAKGESTLSNCLESDDTKYMQSALNLIGIEVHQNENQITVNGQGGTLKESLKPIFLGNAGTAVRFLTAACCLSEGPYIITGDEHMQKRPISPLTKSLRNLGIEINDTNGCPPVIINKGNFAGGTTSIDGSISSQYISALLMIAPLATQQNTQIIIENNLTSKPYIDVTLKMMEQFGATVENKNYQEFFITKNQQYHPQHINIEGDYSSASYFAAIALLHKSSVTLNNLDANSKQGDKRFIELLSQMGATISNFNNSCTISCHQELKTLGTIDMNDIPDMVPTMAILAASINGETKIVNVANLRIKETDRLLALENELTKIGVKVQTTQDSIHINGDPLKLHGAEIATYSDHRIAMSFACLGSIVPGIKILNPKCVAKSYPNFWHDLEQIGIHTV